MRKACSRIPRDPRGCITRRTPLADDQKRDLGIAYHVSLQSILRGSGSEQAWSTLACALNIALILCEQGVGASYLHAIQIAQEALLSCRERAQKFQRWAFSGDEARLVMRACAIHDEQIAIATKSQIVFALEEVNRRVMGGEAA